ncbi:MAG: radical SAM protein [Ruminococcaceae bacterium]|nr:radical SAM protein [Oscillospiraceae bacterium]
MKRFYKIYLEISNVCNLSCEFCPGTLRRPRVMGEKEFAFLLPRLLPYTDYLYFHLMGEPLCHPNLEPFLKMAHNYGFKVILTTNGTLLKQKQEILLSSPALHKINISLHAFEANDISVPFSKYLSDCFEFGKAAEGKKLVVYRLWNSGGADKRNEEISDTLKEYFTAPWEDNRSGKKIGDKVFLEYGDKFDWPSLDAPDMGEKMFCYGLRDHIGVLADGSVVPCCLDHDGDITLGNLFEQSMDEILSSERAVRILDGFDRRIATEPLCRRCGYAHMKFK